MKFFPSPKRSLRTRFAWSMVIVLLPFLAAVALGQLYLRPQLIKPLDDIVQEHNEEIEPMIHLQVAMLQATISLNNYLLDGNPDERRQFTQLRQRVEQAFHESSFERLTLAEGHAFVISARLEWMQALPLSAQLLRLSKPLGNRVAGRDMDRFDAHIERAVSMLDKAYDHFHQVLDKDRAKANATSTNAMWDAFAALGLMLGISLLASLALSGPVVVAVDALSKATALLAEGNLSTRAVLNRQDELGLLALAFNAMADEIEKRTLQLSKLNQIAVNITSSLNSRDVLDEIMHNGIALAGAVASCIAFCDEDTRRFTRWVTQGLSKHFIANISFRTGGLADESFSSGSYILSNDRPENRHKLSRLAREEGLRCFICLPLTSRDHRLGVAYFYRTDRDTFTPAEIELLTTFVSLAVQVIDNTRLYAQMQKQARTDALTGLNNRGEFQRQLKDEEERSRRYIRPLSLLLLDIDHFKRVNDTHGHQAGDVVLKGLGEVLIRQVRTIDRVCRYGGEEIAVILPETGLEAAAYVAERMRAAVEAQPFEVNTGTPPLHITVSIGVASSVLANGAEALVAAADAALYASKRSGRNRVSRYEPALDQPVARE